jgi:hypothetical protein
MKDRFILALLLIAVVLTGLFWGFSERLTHAGLDVPVLIVGNLLMAITTLISYLLKSKGISNTSTHSFVGAVYGSVLLKMIVCLGGIMAYVFITKPDYSKATIFILLLFYLIYTIYEVRMVTKK